MQDNLRKPIYLRCCCCGDSVYGRQWFNRDKGYGLCDNCTSIVATKESPEQMLSYYGYKGIHYSIKVGG